MLIWREQTQRPVTRRKGQIMIGELLGIGNTASVYEWGKTEVIKIFHDQSRSMHEAKKEAKNAKIINNLNLRAPNHSGLLEYEGTSCLIYEKIDGPTMLKQIEPTKVSISHYAKLMAQLHFEMHNIEIKMNSNLKTELTNKINTAEVIKEYEKQFAINVLNALPEGNALCHYDFHPGNIILSSNGPIIIDWMNVVVGNQAADVTRTSMMIQSHALPSNAPGWLIKREYREFFNREYLREYLMLSGMNQKVLEEWMAPTLAARVCEVNGEDRNEVIDKLQLL
ncbi:aminoglycoside phosphotransferase family protein [Paenibacillus polymyxa]|uniref:aminoglycoside phosphotransferase family protein n=1 Tax=Paenibacillus polymyxa TaxID=1406 RepID=UPI0021652BFD|nr:aminoglycoside phosphotransferase family protein [Paenibacillus polymyxa]MEB4782778.1 aminoglycoside phosphotransferase family protein [Paenibacillus jamilae]